MRKQIALATTLSILSLTTATSASAQTVATADAATFATILPADPAQRPVPASGVGVSYTGAPLRSRRAQAFEWGCRTEAQLALSSAALNYYRSPAAILASGLSIEGVQLRSPQGQRYSAHIVRPLRARPLTAACDFQAPPQKQIVVSLE